MKKILIVSGLSGAGKSTVIKILEDMGFFCIDNLPPALLNDFMAIVMSSSIDRIALVLDVRSAQFGDLAEAVKKLLQSYGESVTVLFLEASKEELIRRFSITRRKHPLEGKVSLSEAIDLERDLLQEIRNMSLIIDTTEMDIQSLREKVSCLLSIQRIFLIRLRSFGFKYGLPADTDFVLDTRFMPNPYYCPDLAPLDGRDERIKSFFESHEKIAEYIQHAASMIKTAAEEYKKAGRAGITVSIGCTGGRHRSVYVAEKLAEKLSKEFEVHIEHRDVNK
ncbi:RNase adapter RapZ [Pseudothermotoga sp.]|uniref:RNase adapter RapZ n=1 Tax=Pseudothermotoga sp. TaxID=2033661 RepID=UPI0031F648B6